MKHAKSLPLFLMLVLSTMFFALGCEDSPDTENVDSYFDGRDISTDMTTPANLPERAEPIEPGQDTMVIGPSGTVQVDTDGEIVEITLAGADGAVSWSIAEPGRGEFVTRSTTGATYRRTAAGDNVVVATDSSGRSVSKVIKQPAAEPAEVEPLVLSPDGIPEIAADGTIIELSLSGAVGTVTWSVEDSGRGEIVTSSSTGATYRRLSAGDNVVTATDSASRSAFKVIKQP